MIQVPSLLKDQRNDLLLPSMRRELATLKSNFGPLFPDNLGASIASFEPHFLAGSEEQQRVFIARTSLYNQLIASGLHPETDFRDSRFLWSLFNILGIKPPSSLMNKIDMNDYIEIRDSNGLHTFGNMNFLKILSYSFEELFWYSWEDLFSRNEKINDLIKSQFIRAVTYEEYPFDPEIPEHLCSEKKSAELRSAKVKMNLFSPLFSNRNDGMKYMLAASKITRIH